MIDSSYQDDECEHCVWRTRRYPTSASLEMYSTRTEQNCQLELLPASV